MTDNLKPHRVVDIDYSLPGEAWGCACGWRGVTMHDHRMHVKEVDDAACIQATMGVATVATIGPVEV